MTKYQENVLYIGNLVEYKNGKVNILQENLYLVYNKEKDRFESFIDTYYPSMNLISGKFNEDEIEKMVETINSYKYSYIPSKEEGAKYIDENSIHLLETQNKNKSRT